MTEKTHETRCGLIHYRISEDFDTDRPHLINSIIENFVETQVL